MDDPRYGDDDRGQDDDSDEMEPVRFPGGVMAAGVIWIGVGCLSLINMMASFAMQGANGGAGAGAGAGAGCCPGLIGLAFLVCGYQTVTGQASDTRGNGVGSLLLGSLQVLGAALIAFGGFMVGQNGARNGPPAEVMLIIAAFVAVMGGVLIIAGLLALSGRSAYREWRFDNVIEPQRQRRRRREERREREEREDRDERDDRGDDDDKPWKRR